MKAEKNYPQIYFLRGDRNFPGSKFPLLLYKKVFPGLKAGKVKENLEKNNWTNAWTNGIYDYHHYHSTTHEVLVIVEGSAMVLFGGPEGNLLPVSEGDAVVIPAGVAHKRIESSSDFKCVGAYPDGEEYDMKFGLLNERNEAESNIRKAGIPFADPVLGKNGPLIEIWNGIKNERKAA